MPGRIRRIGEILGFHGERKSAKITSHEPKVEPPEETSKTEFRTSLRERLTNRFRLKKHKPKKKPRPKSKEPGVGENIDIDS